MKTQKKTLDVLINSVKDTTRNIGSGIARKTAPYLLALSLAACNGGGGGGDAPVVPPSDTTKPTVYNISINQSGQNAVLSWNSSDNIAVTGQTIYRNGVAMATLGAADTAFTDSDVVGNQCYDVIAEDAAGNKSDSVQLCTDITDVIAPGKPSLTATPCNDTTQNICLSSSAADNVGTTLHEFFDENGNSLGTSADGNKIITGLTPNKVYTFTAKASDAAGNQSALSDIKTAKTDALPVPMTTISVNGSRLLPGGASDITAKFIEGSVPSDFNSLLSALNSTAYSANLTPALKGDANSGNYTGTMQIPQGKTGCIYIIGNTGSASLAERGDQTSIPQCFTTSGANQNVAANIEQILVEDGTYDSTNGTIFEGTGYIGEQHPLYATLTPEENVLKSDGVADMINKSTMTVLVEPGAEVMGEYPLNIIGLPNNKSWRVCGLYDKDNSKTLTTNDGISRGCSTLNVVNGITPTRIPVYDDYQ